MENRRIASPVRVKRYQPSGEEEAPGIKAWDRSDSQNGFGFEAKQQAVDSPQELIATFPHFSLSQPVSDEDFELEVQVPVIRGISNGHQDATLPLTLVSSYPAGKLGGADSLEEEGFVSIVESTASLPASQFEGAEDISVQQFASCATAVDNASDDEEFDYAFSGGEREGKGHVREFRPEPAPQHLITNVQSALLESFAEEDEEEADEQPAKPLGLASAVGSMGPPPPKARPVDQRNVPLPIAPSSAPRLDPFRGITLAGFDGDRGGSRRTPRDTTDTMMESMMDSILSSMNDNDSVLSTGDMYLTNPQLAGAPSSLEPAGSEVSLLGHGSAAMTQPPAVSAPLLEQDLEKERGFAAGEALEGVATETPVKAAKQPPAEESPILGLSRDGSAAVGGGVLFAGFTVGPALDMPMPLPDLTLPLPRGRLSIPVVPRAGTISSPPAASPDGGAQFNSASSNKRRAWHGSPDRAAVAALFSEAAGMPSPETPLGPIDSGDVDVWVAANAARAAEIATTATAELPLVTYQEALEHFMAVDITMDEAHSESDRSGSVSEGCGFVRMLSGCFGPTPDEQSGRRRIIWLARQKFSDEDPMHLRMLQAIYCNLTGKAAPAGRVDARWEDIGFQGSDPATDLRSCGMLGLMHLLLLTSHSRADALALYRLSKDPVQEFPLATVSLNISKWTLEMAQSGRLHTNSSPTPAVSFLAAAGEFYLGAFNSLYYHWKVTKCTMKIVGFILPDIKRRAQANPSGMMRKAHQRIVE